MQGRPGQGGEARNRPPGRRIESLNGTGKHPTIPQRPPGMVRVSQPPATPRVARPQPEKRSVKDLRRQILIVGGIFVACAILASIVGLVGYNVINAANQSAGAANTATHFISSFNTQNYQEAYKDLGTSITFKVPQDQFVQQASNTDRCLGPVKDFTVPDNGVTNEDNIQKYTFDIKRSKTGKALQIQLTLQQEQDNSWKITDYGNLITSSGACS